MCYLLDTNIIILYLKGDIVTIHLLTKLAQQSSEPFCVSTVTQMEVWEGMYAAPDPHAAERQYQAFFDEVTLLPFSSDVAKRGAKLRHDLRQQSIRTRDRALDLQIAATALYHGLELVTYNDQDYDDITGLTLYQK
ncbi:MAG: type II toxin-antitoxin system VapC family toxin [Thermomicrobia bacterium]|nr:type II toxin-antitoxin system VapC family toxin [Thermomicrobia bacterium]MCA1723539.1 type II toxin-antitoxin system VapC family toxin [Thermomicrobia bacterium]